MRYRAGRPTGVVKFGRRAGATGTVVIPAGTPVTDAHDTIRYETTETRTMQAGESVCEMQVRATTDATPAVPEHTLVVVQRAIAGIDTVDNERPTAAAAVDETDAELRARAKVALQVANKGTPAAIRDGLLALPDVRDVVVEELPERGARRAPGHREHGRRRPTTCRPPCSPSSRSCDRPASGCSPARRRR